MPRGRPRTTPLPTLADTPHERAPNEAPADYEAFCTFARLGATRTLPKVAAETGRSLRSIQMLSTHRAWRHRVEAWDRDHAAAFVERMAVLQAATLERQHTSGVGIEERLLVAAVERLERGDDSEMETKDLLRELISWRKEVRTTTGIRDSAGPAVSVTTSVAVAFTSLETLTPDQLVALAERALGDEHPEALCKLLDVLLEVDSATPTRRRTILGQLEP